MILVDFLWTSLTKNVHFYILYLILVFKYDKNNFHKSLKSQILQKIFTSEYMLTDGKKKKKKKDTLLPVMIMFGDQIACLKLWSWPWS